MTTLLSSISEFLYLTRGLLSLLACDIVDSVADGLDGLSVLIGDLDVESLFEFHDELYRVEGVSTEVAGEVCFRSYFAGFAVELFDDDFDYLFVDL